MNEQKAYDDANKAYQKEWRKAEPLRDHYNKAVNELLHVAPDNHTQPYVEAMVSARQKLRGAEIRTGILLERREAAYKALVAARKLVDG